MTVWRSGRWRQTSERSRTTATRLWLTVGILGLLVGFVGAERTTAGSTPNRVAGPAVPAANSQTYVDATGDNAGGSPDVTTVRVSNDDAGNVTFELVLQNRVDLADVDLVNVYLDTDRDASTGCPLIEGLFGADWSLGVRGKTEPELDGDPYVLHWTGCEPDPPDPDSFVETKGAFDVATSTLTLRVNKKGIGDPSGFRFAVVAQTAPIPEAKWDFAPNRFTWSYEIRVSPVLPPRDRTPPRVKALPSSGVTGGTAKLRYTVFDESRKAREEIRILRGGKSLAMTKTKLGPRNVAKIYARTWRVPEGVAGKLQFCVRAWDATGNRSSQSCSALTIR